MRKEHEHRTRPSTNGSSSQNGSGSPSHTNGSIKGETNGFHTNGDGPMMSPRSKEPYFGHDREEVTRILLQSLSDLGYSNAAQQLSRESGYELEIPSVAAFRSAVQRGEWEEAEALLLGTGDGGGGGEVDGGVSLGNGVSLSPAWRRRDRLSIGSRTSNGFGQDTNGLPLAEGVDTTMLRFLLRQQKYLELLESRDLGTALSVLRNELTPLKRDTTRLHFLSSLMMCPTPQDLRREADWDGAEGQSRNHLLSEVSRSISPSIMIPEHRLGTLLTSVQQEQILNCRFHNTTVQPSLYTDHDCTSDDFPLQQLTQLTKHSDEVWHLDFSHDGTMLATAGRDGLVTIYDTHTWNVIHELREHEPPRQSQTNPAESGNQGVCYIAWSPDDRYLISCGQNNTFVVVRTDTAARVAIADHFDYPVTTAAWLPDSQSFVVGTQSSRRPLGLYSIRSNGNSSNISRNNEIHSWRDPPFDPASRENGSSFRVTDCAVSRDGSRLVAATISNKLFVYDLHTRHKIAEWPMEDKITSVNFDADRDEILVNMNEGHVVALDAGTGEVVMGYEGAQQREFVIRSCFGGAGENFVASGSEDSKVYIWRRQTGQQVATLDGHGQGTVNAVAWHPQNPAIFASCGDDRKVRIWASANFIRRRDSSSGSGGVGVGGSGGALLGEGAAGRGGSGSSVFTAFAR